ncbi:protein AF-17-like isoform X2 [Denticeps clupeoides]|nr:protein AF-17 isoform X2 [Denticeps clupeoides]
MEPIVLQYVPHERYIKTCYICEDHGRESKAACGACMTCNRSGCKQAFHVTCAQMAGLLCEEEGPEADNVKYCGYCKYHYSKMQKKMRSSSDNTGGSFSQPRGHSTSPSQDKHSSHHHRPRKSHKDKTKLKERHKKASDSSIPSLGSSLSSNLEKLSSSHHSSSKDGEGKSKKLSSHGLGYRSKKSGNPGKSCSSSSCSSSPFNAGGASLSTNTEFLQFSSHLERDRERDVERNTTEESTEVREERVRTNIQEEEEEEEEKDEEEKEAEEKEQEEETRKKKRKHHTPPLQPPALTPANGPQGHERLESDANTFETKVTISTYGSIMRITSSSGLGSGSKVRKLSSKPSSNSLPSTPPVLDEAGQKNRSSSPSRERRHRGNKKSRHGPGRPRGSKNRERERKEDDHHHHHHHHNQQQQQGAPTFSSSLYPSPPRLPPAAFPASSSTVRSTSSLLSSGIYTSHKEPLSLGGSVCSTSLSSGLLPSHMSSLPIPPNSAPNTQMHSGPSVSYSLSSSQAFGSCLSAAPSLPPLLSQAQSSLPESDLEDCRYPCQGSSPRESLSSQSPMSSLPLLFDQRDSLGHTRPPLENVPPASSHIELLLEKHGNGEMGVNIVEMLQSLHSLQQENQRLQDQILSLTAKKERLQLLNVELAVPFMAPAQTSIQAPQAPPPAPAVSTQMSSLSSSHDPLCTSKSPLTKSCFLSDNSFIASSEEFHSGSPSRSSSSLSFQSTPPPQQSPASFGQPLLNGLGRGLGEGFAGIGGTGSVVSGLIAGLTGSPQLSMDGVLGVIQSPIQGTSQTPLSALQTQPLTTHTLPQGHQLLKSLSPSTLLSEQQKQLLLQKQQQQQLQQFLTSQNFTPEQQVVVYQMLQQQRQHELQRLSGTLSSAPSAALSNTMISQSPGLLPSATGSPLQASQGNALFGLQDNALHKSGSVGEKGGDKN